MGAASMVALRVGLCLGFGEEEEGPEGALAMGMVEVVLARRAEEA
jgi:hypothetical protein